MAAIHSTFAVLPLVVAGPLVGPATTAWAATTGDDNQQPEGVCMRYLAEAGRLQTAAGAPQTLPVAS
ncbi:hypothetical protein [Dactylosporangium matsuzakiense]|uniref:Uncharacterized protein n=1 Tax=Dactylosporangium matsuzakiense TaxID=53360 RepID=A0A9W6KVP2_9ACTN|nr:hypothetical protein [Dactylosporangium matsuzakiense]UWZ48180.1 hypothetical protein Dmats_18310 [Dactylosporangium matsuzakiense]GLL08543.1 hypothetical protein GCM10017581_103100 [Dactylosporangium matsuzakiense]